MCCSKMQKAREFVAKYRTQPVAICGLPHKPVMCDVLVVQGREFVAKYRRARQAWFCRNRLRSVFCHTKPVFYRYSSSDVLVVQG